MLTLNCKIKSNKALALNIYEIILEAPEIAKIAEPGQFVNIKVSPTTEPLLRRPISICRIEDEDLILVYQVVGKGTELLSKLTIGQYVNLLGPLGSGFPLEKKGKSAVLGGGIGTAPLLELVKRMGDSDAYLGFRSEPYQIDEFKKYCKRVVVATEDGSVGEKGWVIDCVEDIKKYDVVYACGPKIFLQKVKELCEENQVLCYISLEERMGCGIGACLVCNCKVKTGNDFDYKRVCKDGPVFDSREVILND